MIKQLVSSSLIVVTIIGNINAQLYDINVPSQAGVPNFVDRLHQTREDLAYGNQSKSYWHQPEQLVSDNKLHDFWDYYKHRPHLGESQFSKLQHNKTLLDTYLRDLKHYSHNITEQIQNIEQKFYKLNKEVIEEISEDLRQSVFKNKLALCFLFLTYIAMLISEVHFNNIFKKYEKISRSCMKLRDTSQVWREYEGQYVYIQGRIRYEQKPSIQDEYFGISLNAPILKREVHMLQWQELREARKDLAKAENLSDMQLFKYTYVPVWSKHLIDSEGFNLGNQLYYQNPQSFGFVKPELYTPQHIYIGAYQFDRNFILNHLIPQDSMLQFNVFSKNYLESDDNMAVHYASQHSKDFSESYYLTLLDNIDKYFPLGFHPPVDYKGAWTMNGERNMLERKAHHNRETIGDMRVHYYTIVPQNNRKQLGFDQDTLKQKFHTDSFDLALRRNLQSHLQLDNPVTVSIIGKQKGMSIKGLSKQSEGVSHSSQIFKDNTEDLLIIKIGEFTKKELIREETKDIKRRRRNVQWVIFTCLLMIQQHFFQDLISMMANQEPLKWITDRGKNHVSLMLISFAANFITALVFPKIFQLISKLF
eukprot:403370955